MSDRLPSRTLSASSTRSSDSSGATSNAGHLFSDSGEPFASEPVSFSSGTRLQPTRPFSAPSYPPPGEALRSAVSGAVVSAPKETDEDQKGSIGGFLKALLASALHDNNDDDDDEEQEEQEEEVTPQQNENLHIEYLLPKHDMIDLSTPINIKKPVSTPSIKPVSPHSQSLGISSLLSYGKSFFSAITDSAPSTSPGEYSSSSHHNLTNSTREERDSLLDLHLSQRPVVLSRGPKMDENAPVILSNELAAQLRPSLPPLYRESPTWRLIYSLDHHGISLNTLYHNCESLVGTNGSSGSQGGDPVLLVIKDVDGGVFGAFASETLKVHNGYYGNGSCFLWKRVVEKHADHHHASDSSDTDTPLRPKPDVPKIRVFKATGLNDYLILGEAHMIAMGGGEGHFGLWVDQDLYNGHSGPCQTFQNERLSVKSEFVIQSLEIWAFDI
ncbi:Nuclear receptor coactivator 7 [Podochytrium sp. JEL0797]|nr:Nuclear receptor coactivator 7 [Podochytrium sp. JEL0797]